MGTDEGLSAPGEQAIFRVAVLASGSGTNLQAVIDQLHRPRFELMDSDEYGTAPRTAEKTAGGPRIEVVLVISDMPDARAIDRATRAGIRTALLPVSDYRDREQHDLAVVTKLLEVEPDLVVLAGYMRIVAPSLLKAFPWRVINLHPALLPAFPGTHSIADAVRYGVKMTGVTVHFVDAGVDTGPVIAQEAVRVQNGDTAETLAARIHELEHRILPEVVRLFAEGRVKPPLPGSRVVQVDWGTDNSK